MMEKTVFVMVYGKDGDIAWVNDGEGHDFEVAAQGLRAEGWNKVDPLSLKDISRDRIIEIARKQSESVYGGKTDTFFDIFSGKISPEDFLKGLRDPKRFLSAYNPVMMYQVSVLGLLEKTYEEMAKKEEVSDIQEQKEEEEVMCSCGHFCPRSLVMSTSQGTSCPDCYDRMSEDL
jgi:uncharacterized protein with ParB-like and HNH nuclease domain